MEDHDRMAAMPYRLVQRFVLISLIVGLLSGAVGGALVARTGSTSISKQKIITQDSSAIIDVIKKVSPSVVSISFQGARVGLFGFSQNVQGAGTGIILTDDGLIMTNKHVVESDGVSYSVITSDGKEYKDAKVVARDSTNDVAFIRIAAHNLKPAELGDSSNLEVGQRVVAIGNALGQFQNSATEGIISGLGRPIVAGDETSSEPLSNLIQTDAAINPGNSGGPLVNAVGQVIGVNTAVAQAQNIGFAIPIKEITGAINSVRSRGKIVHPYLGVRYSLITPQFATDNNLKVNGGAYITGDRTNLAVIPDSPAAKAGLREGDIIIKIDDKKIDPSQTLSSLISVRKVGDKIKVTYLRENKEQTVGIILEEAPSS